MKQFRPLIAVFALLLFQTAGADEATDGTSKLYIVGAPSGSAIAEISKAGADVVGEYWRSRTSMRLIEKDATWLDPDLTNAVNLVTDRLLSSASLPPDMVETAIKTCPQAMAYANESGALTICLPVFFLIETADELAFVVAHEIAHTLMEEPGDADQLRSFYTGKSRAELEGLADRIGVDLMVAAGYSPEGALLFLQSIGSASGRLCCDKHYLPPDARLVELSEYTDRLYTEETDSRPLTPHSSAVFAAKRRASDYMAGIEEIFEKSFEFQARAEDMARATTLPPGQNTLSYSRGACLSAIESMSELAQERGGSPILVQASLAISNTCLQFADVPEALRSLWIGHSDLSSLDFNQLASMMLALPVVKRTKLEADIKDELKARVSADRFDGLVASLIALEERGVSERELGFALNKFRIEHERIMGYGWAICRLAGNLEDPDFDPVTEYAVQQQLKMAFGQQERTIREGCEETYSKFSSERSRIEQALRSRNSSVLNVGYASNASRWMLIPYYNGESEAMIMQLYR